MDIKMKHVFSNVPNIGSVLAQKLQEAEIESLEHLRRIGAEAAFIRLHTIDATICINTLYALEGAVEGIRWHDLSDEKKQDLLILFKSLQ